MYETSVVLSIVLLHNITRATVCKESFMQMAITVTVVTDHEFSGNCTMKKTKS